MWIHRCHDERLPKGPRFASESLDADTASESVSSKLTHYPLSGLQDGANTKVLELTCLAASVKEDAAFSFGCKAQPDFNGKPICQQPGGLLID